MSRRYLLCIGLSLCCTVIWAASDFAPAVPDLELPAEDVVESATVSEPAPQLQQVEMPKQTTATSKAKQNTSKKAAAKKSASKEEDTVITVTTADLNNDLVMVEKMNPQLPEIQSGTAVKKDTPVVAETPKEQEPQEAVEETEQAESSDEGETLKEQEEATEAAAEEKKEADQKAQPKPKKPRVTYNPATAKDPTLSPDDLLILKHREEERLRAIEAEKQRKIEAERKRLAELERQRRLELERLKDPSKEIRGKIHLNGIIGQEVFIGNKVYTVGDTVLGARIVSIQSDEVVFMYKGQKFAKKVKLQ